jgi:hypothetical protein
VVQALLAKSDSPRMREALLLAIYLGHVQIAEAILRQPRYTVHLSTYDILFINESKLNSSIPDSHMSS